MEAATSVKVSFQCVPSEPDLLIGSTLLPGHHHHHLRFENEEVYGRPGNIGCVLNPFTQEMVEWCGGRKERGEDGTKTE